MYGSWVRVPARSPYFDQNQHPYRVCGFFSLNRWRFRWLILNFPFGRAKTFWIPFTKKICNPRGYVVYLCMIQSIRHKGLRLLWEKNDPSKLPANQVDKISRILEALDTAKTLEPIRAIPGYWLHALTGNQKGVWSVTVTGNFRITFRFDAENIFDVDYVDYH